MEMSRGSNKKDTSQLSNRQEDSKFGNTSNSMDLNKTIYKFKTILVGNIAVGKTSILGRFIGNQFSSSYKCSINVDFKVKSIQIDKSTVADLTIWDTCGDEKYRAITKQYYNQAQGVIAVFDITNHISFVHLDCWLDDIRNSSAKNPVIFIVGNKSDLESDRKVTQNQITAYTQSRDIEYLEVSAKTGTNIHLLFEKLANKLVKIKANQNDGDKEEFKNLSNVTFPKQLGDEKKGCC